MTTGSRLKKLREEKGLSQEEVAKLVGVSREAVTFWETGRTKPIRKLKELSALYNVSADYILGKSDLPLSNEVPVSAAVNRYPIIGTVKCGPDGLAYEYLDGFFTTSDEYSGDIRGFKCKGDSMKGEGINDGDIVLVRIQPDVENGELAVVVINGDEGTLKRIRKDTNYITLEAANPDYPSRTFAGEKMNEVHIVGRVIELKRKH